MSPVVVPERLRPVVWNVLVTEVRRRQLIDGGAMMTRELFTFLQALRRDDESSTAPGFANETALSGSGTVVLTTQDVAEQLGCSPQWARKVARRIGTRVGRQWLVEQDTFDKWRTT